jgi:hypothetical protein
MALYKIDGFDLWPAPTVAPSGSPFLGDESGGASLSSTVVAFSDTASKSLAFNSAVPVAATQCSLPSSVSAIVIGFNFQYSGVLVGSRTDLIIFLTTFNELSLYIDSSAKLHIKDVTGNTVLGSGTTSLIQGQWYHIDFKLTLSQSVSTGDCVLSLDGTSEIAILAGTATSEGPGGVFSHAAVGAIPISGGSTAVVYYDDFYIFDTTGGSDNSAFGSEHVHSVAPSTLSLVSKGNFLHGVASDSGSFTGAGSSHAQHVGSAASSATLSDNTSSVATRVASASSSATFSPAASSGSNQPSGFTGYAGTRLSSLGNIILAYGATLGRIIRVSASDSVTASSSPTEKDVGNRAVSASGGAQFVSVAAAHHNPSVSASDTATFFFDATIQGRFVHASDSGKFTGAASSNPRGRAADSFSFHSVATAGGNRTTSASDHATFTDSANAHKPTVIQQHLSDSFYFIRTFADVHDTRVLVAASDSFTFSDDAEKGGHFRYSVKPQDKAFFYLETATSTVKRAIGKGVSDSGRFSDRAATLTLHVRALSFSDTARFTDTASTVNVAAPKTHSLSLSSAGTFSDSATAVKHAAASGSDSASFSAVAAPGREFPVASSDSATLSGTLENNRFYAKAASDGATFTGAASKAKVGPHASDSATFTGLASASVLLPSGLTIPGGDQSAGLRQVLFSPLSQEFPLSYAESPEGILLMANGVDAPIAWDGVSATAWTAGVQTPDQVVWLSASGSGSLLGRRWAYMRYVDSRGNYGNLSQISDPIDLGRDGFISGVTYNSSGVVTVRSYDHGLSSGDAVTISDVNGIASVAGVFSISVSDANHFTLGGLVVTGGVYQSGGVWTKGAASVTYSNLELPTDPKIVRRQILRNLAGNTATFYVDIDTTDLTSTTLSSSQTDEQLATCSPVPVLWTNRDGASNRVFQGDSPAAMRFGVPPAHKRALASYAGRLFAASDVAYSSGNVSVTAGSPYVLGIGTAFTPSFVGRLLYVDGNSAIPRSIASVSTVAGQQVLTLELPYNGPSNQAASYTIRPAPVERSLVYYSEPHLPEAWPAWNAFSVPETDDEITGLAVFKSFLYILKERNVFKFAYKLDPGRDGYCFPCVRRGCINNRCAVYVDGSLYMLDEMGVHEFDGDNTESISEAVGSVFTPDGASAYNVDWSADRTFWHASHDQVRHTIRWHIDFVGTERLTLAICYDYRGEQWWLEQYAEPISSSVSGVASGYRRSLLGTTARRVFATGVGTLDGLSELTTGTTRGTVCTGDSLTITDDTASFAPNLAGVPVALVDGTGAGQTAVVSDNTSTTLTLVRPLAVQPDETTTYQIGGVPWQWKSGWRRLADDEEEAPRDLEMVWKPTQNPSTMDVKIFYDHHEDPSNWAYAIDVDGITKRDGEPHTIFDLSSNRGYAVQRLTGHRDSYGYGHRYIAIQASGAQGVDPTLVYQIILDGAE